MNAGLLDRDYEPQRQNEVDILRKRYNEFILYSDQQFKLFLNRLTKIIDMSNTIVILSSDHGEIFSKGYLGHGGPHLYAPLVHIPLIIKMSWKTNGEGRIIDTPVEQLYIASTILDLAGISVLEWMEGHSLVPLLEGKAIEPKPIFSMQLIKNRVIGNQPITKGTIAVWEGDYKLIKYLEGNKSLLFDLMSDPEEMKDISKEKPEITEQLEKLIEGELSRINARITQFK